MREDAGARGVARERGQRGSSRAAAGSSSLPIALVYRGPAGCRGCSEPVAALLRTAPSPFRVVYCGPGEDVRPSAQALSSAVLYAQPGGGDDVGRAWSQMRRYARDIRAWVRGGGHYLGICMGGYLAGSDPGFGLLPGDSDRYITAAGATVRTAGDAMVTVSWRGQSRCLYFQDGPYFTMRRGCTAAVLATYADGLTAAVVARCGKGSVGVCGPHPEAPASWYREAGLETPGGVRLDLGYDLIEATITM